jgi:hypothetical protein
MAQKVPFSYGIDAIIIIDAIQWSRSGCCFSLL